MGTVSYGGPTIADGKIFVGTNNERPRDPKAMGDRGVIMCFNEADGSFLWQITHDKLPEPELNDWPKQGIGSYPAYDQKKSIMFPIVASLFVLPPNLHKVRPSLLSFGKLT